MLVTDDRFENIPITLETHDPETMHAVNVRKLWTFAGRTDL